jgi:hypothetical protein
MRAHNKGSVERENGSVPGRSPSPSPGSRTITKNRIGGVAISPVAGLDSQRGEVTRIFTYLGWEWNSLDLTVKLSEIPRKKALLLRKARKQAHKVPSVPVRSLAKLIGVLNVHGYNF